ncbi:hypothetical protein [Vagococcus fluvialis]|uniref:hypothetical protein n=1 Tax=Vagococcus fluvialis TaxID=2738 RepID=UPI001D0B103B|nr:hypothetical protein [Vagococcus fluvialis]UDM74059.1 hypothetical protein K5K99_00015 [Vagococcus fluvialis]
MATNRSLLARIKRMEQILGPDIIAFSAERRRVIESPNGWEVSRLNFDTKEEAEVFSNNLKEQGLMAYLEEIEKRLTE